jgi:hypothetical protein
MIKKSNLLFVQLLNFPNLEPVELLEVAEDYVIFTLYYLFSTPLDTYNFLNEKDFELLGDFPTTSFKFVIFTGY